MLDSLTKCSWQGPAASQFGSPLLHSSHTKTERCKLRPTAYDDPSTSKVAPIISTVLLGRSGRPFPGPAHDSPVPIVQPRAHGAVMEPEPVQNATSKYLKRRLPTANAEPSKVAEQLNETRHETQGGRANRATSYADRRLPAVTSCLSGSSMPHSEAPTDQEKECPAQRREPYLLRRRQIDFTWVDLDRVAGHQQPQASGTRLSIHGRGSHIFRTAEDMLHVGPLAFGDSTDKDYVTSCDRQGGRLEHLEPVLLNIYDLGDSKAIQRLNVLLKPMGSGAYHAAVQVYGQEWSFGGLSIDDPIEEGFETGIWSCRPQGCRQHSYRESVAMGHTSHSHVQILEIIRGMMDEWPMNSYQILRRNCCHFCDAFCQLIGVGPLPAWVLNLAGVGASLESMQTSTSHATASAASVVRDFALRIKKVPA